MRDADAILAIRAPDGSDMTVLLGSLPLALLGTGFVFADVPKDQLLTYRNCLPGRAKKEAPCVPPGLTKKGVTYEEGSPTTTNGLTRSTSTSVAGTWIRMPFLTTIFCCSTQLRLHHFMGCAPQPAVVPVQLAGT